MVIKKIEPFTMQTISAKELRQRMSHGEDIVLIDVREPYEFDICHLEGARLIPMQTLPEHIDAFASTRPTVVYCHHGIRSMSAINYLAQVHGIKNLMNLVGGIDAWSKEVDPAVRQY
jgi:sulfur-carrier protein adenylyltransferase/sulfurtransferase